MTTAEREAARERLRAHDRAEAQLLASRGGHFGTLTAQCNACDVDTPHPGCEGGYCNGCCPTH